MDLKRQFETVVKYFDVIYNLVDYHCRYKVKDNFFTEKNIQDAITYNGLTGVNNETAVRELEESEIITRQNYNKYAIDYDIYRTVASHYYKSTKTTRRDAISEWRKNNLP